MQQQLTVSGLLRYLKNRLDNDNNIQRIYVAGEISNYHRHFSGHLYFTLKDEHAAISCVMFKSATSTLRFEPKTGDKVIVFGSVSIFEASGQMQLYVQRITLDGLGDLYARYEALKKKLAEEGKFDPEHKKTLSTSYPEKIAVLVGDKSAAMSDIKTAFARRWPLCKVTYYPVLVQGSEAPADIINRLDQVDEMGYDAIIIARGGGSFEDLFCFNDEALVNKVYQAKTFIVSGVGHEQDFTLLDFVADLRAATPTAAVELITPKIDEVFAMIEDLQDSMYQQLLNLLDNRRMSYDLYTTRLLHYQQILRSIANNIDNDIESIKSSILHKIGRYSDRLELYDTTMLSKLDLKLNNERLLLKRLNTLLEAYNAENVLKRGYSLVFQDEKIVKRKAELKKEVFQLRFADGSIDAIERD